jgi:4'-phosphopantetheinyl transferase EntD
MLLAQRIAALQPSLALTELGVGAATIAWLDAGAAVDEAAIDALLLPDEAAYAASVRARSRREEYRRARFLVRALTGYTGPLPRTPEGAPSWPPGLVGSITHKDGAVGVTLAAAAALAAIGIDAEDAARVRPELEPKICSEAESRLLDRVQAAAGRDRAYWLGVVFSFKEALFKCHFPLGGVMFWFHDAELDALDPATGRVRARVLVPTSPRSPAGTPVSGAWIDQATSKGLYVVASVIERAVP